MPFISTNTWCSRSSTARSHRMKALGGYALYDEAFAGASPSRGRPNTSASWPTRGGRAENLATPPRRAREQRPRRLAARRASSSDQQRDQHHEERPADDGGVVAEPAGAAAARAVAGCSCSKPRGGRRVARLPCVRPTHRRPRVGAQLRSRTQPPAAAERTGAVERKWCCRRIWSPSRCSSVTRRKFQRSGASVRQSRRRGIAASCASAARGGVCVESPTPLFLLDDLRSGGLERVSYEFSRPRVLAAVSSSSSGAAEP